MKTLAAPVKPSTINISSRWLSGEGCGSWFHIEKQKANYIISRYSPEGKLECKGLFEIEKLKQFNLKQDYDFAYLSHCAMVTIIQHGKKIRFYIIEKC